MILNKKILNIRIIYPYVRNGVKIKVKYNFNPSKNVFCFINDDIIIPECIDIH